MGPKRRRRRLVKLLNVAIAILEYKEIEINPRDEVGISSAMEDVVGIARPQRGTKLHTRLKASVDAFKNSIRGKDNPDDFERGILLQIDNQPRNTKSQKIKRVKVVVDKVGNQQSIDDFYKSYEWRRLRYWAITKYGRVCMACGDSSQVINVDHIKPLRLNWALRLDPNNMQILCGPCNHGKGNWDATDWRPAIAKTRTFPGNER